MGMSRQIYFIQSDMDAEAFVSEVYRQQGLLVDQQTILTEEESLAVLRRKTSSYVCRFQTIPAQYSPSLLGDLKQKNIEYQGSVRGNALSRTYYTGRLYLSDWLGPVTPELVRFYERLRAYIKKHYVYHKQKQVYFGPVFWENYPSKHWLAAEWTTRRVIELPSGQERFALSRTEKVRKKADGS